MNLSNITIETDRLILAPISSKYEHDIFTEFTPEISKFMPPKPPKKIEETRNFINDSLEKIENGTDFNLVILKKNNFEFLGCASIDDLANKTPELGIWLKKSAHGNKYGFEVIKELTKWAGEKLNCNELIYLADENNISSKKIAIKMGAKQIGFSNKISGLGDKLHMIQYLISLEKS